MAHLGKSSRVVGFGMGIVEVLHAGARRRVSTARSRWPGASFRDLGNLQMSGGCVDLRSCLSEAMDTQVCGECYVGVQVRKSPLHDGSWWAFRLWEHLFRL